MAQQAQVSLDDVSDVLEKLGSKKKSLNYTNIRHVYCGSCYGTKMKYESYHNSSYVCHFCNGSGFRKDWKSNSFKQGWDKAKPWKKNNESEEKRKFIQFALEHQRTYELCTNAKYQHNHRVHPFDKCHCGYK
eukprot:UN05503